MILASSYIILVHFLSCFVSLVNSFIITGYVLSILLCDSHQSHPTRQTGLAGAPGPGS